MKCILVSFKSHYESFYSETKLLKRETQVKCGKYKFTSTWCKLDAKSPSAGRCWSLLRSSFTSSKLLIPSKAPKGLIIQKLCPKVPLIYSVCINNSSSSWLIYHKEIKSINRYASIVIVTQTYVIVWKFLYKSFYGRLMMDIIFESHLFQQSLYHNGKVQYSWQILDVETPHFWLVW